MHGYGKSTDYYPRHISKVQITNNLNSSRVPHECDTRGVNHALVGFLDSTHMYTHMQYLHTRVHAHAVFTHVCVLHVCMLVWIM